MRVAPGGASQKRNHGSRFEYLTLSTNNSPDNRHGSLHLDLDLSKFSGASVTQVNLTHHWAQVGRQSLPSSIEVRLRVTFDREAGLAVLELGRNFDLNLELCLDAFDDIANAERLSLFRATDSLNLVEDEGIQVDWCEDGLCASGGCPGSWSAVTVLSSWTKRGEELLRVCVRQLGGLCLGPRQRISIKRRERIRSAFEAFLTSNRSGKHS